MSTTSKPPHIPEERAVEDRNQFTVLQIVALHSTPFAQGFSKELRHAAIRAILRHGVHRDGTHYDVRKRGGLHPACPGFETKSNITPEDVVMDLYVTPCELRLNEHVGGDTAILVQAFCQEFAIPHLQRFAQHCKMESILPPLGRSNMSPISLEGPNHLPAYKEPLSTRIMCTVCRPDTTAANAASDSSPSAAIREAAKSTAATKEKVIYESATLNTPSLNKVPEAMPSGVRQRRQRHLADAFLTPAEEISTVTNFLVVPSDSSAPAHALISLGPNTDAVLDQFELGDNLLPRLHHLIASVQSSRWEVALRMAPWNLSYEQASNLSRAIAADLKGTPNFAMNTQPKPSILTIILKLLSITILSCLLYCAVPVHGHPPLTTTRPVPSALWWLSHEFNPYARLDPLPFLTKMQERSSEIDKMTKTLASQHHKSIRQVEGSLIYGQASFCRRREKVSPWNAFCWKKHQSSCVADNSNGGKTVLHDLVTGSKEEYHALTAYEKENLVAKYSEFGADKMVRKRVSVSSKINDATHTLQAVESELDNLKARTGVEAILYASRGTTDLPLCQV
ncbi:hypothetical protein L210DRAFT_3648116 [Boletus edulis BED1]|uniref:Uncharacterized protein n=1 Tax=Boletus edulis BED1 TaxID=1328754 RepID=A0AAD4GCL0_BOLED|nr:hypothetical protein L210DRAFT_3648116 [Boletus edulis BED1]